MAITAYTGTPGAGKTYALVSSVIVPGLAAGRTVRANIPGLDVAKCEAMAAEKSDKVGTLIPFESKAMLVPGFFPTEERPTGAVVEPGDLLVIDELRLTFPNRGKAPAKDFEPFLRYHRHMVSDDGIACEVVFGTQLITDVHRDYRGLIERSYKFKKLSAVGMSNSYSYFVFEGHEQRKGAEYSKGTGRFKAKYFDLYKSYDTDGEAEEVQSDKRATMFSGSFIAFGVVALVGLCGGGYMLASFLSRGEDAKERVADRAPVVQRVQAQPETVSTQFRIVGFVENQSFPIVLLTDGEQVFSASASDFSFKNGRPISGYFRGQRVEASDLLSPSRGAPVAPVTSLLPDF